MISGKRRIFSAFISKKLSPVFLCFTLRNWRSVISFNWKNDQWNEAHLFCIYIRKSNIQHSHENSLFTFGEPLLDAESSLENVLDTNITSFLRRFWIRYQNGTTSNKKKVTCLVLQVVFFSKIPPGGSATCRSLHFFTPYMPYIHAIYTIHTYNTYIQYIHTIPYIQ